MALTLSSIPLWVSENIRFPEEAYRYGIVGTERVCISVSWDGKAFITNPLNALCPAYEDEIKRVVGSMPECVPPVMADPRYVFVSLEIDFTKLANPDSLANLRVIDQWAPPTNDYRGHQDYLNSREDLLEQVYSSLKVPAEWNEKADTVHISYTVAVDGKLRNISVTQCEDPFMVKQIERALGKARKWTPARTRDSEVFAVTVHDRIIVAADPSGRKKPYVKYVDKECQNSTNPPLNPDQVIVNPEFRARIDLGKAFPGKVTEFYFKSNPDRKASFGAIFIIEKDGSASNILVYNAPDSVSMRELQSEISRYSYWTPARQGGVAVRSVYAFDVTRKMRKDAVSGTDFSVFGKYYLDNIASHSKRDNYYTSPDGKLIMTYPINSSGNFDNGYVRRIDGRYPSTQKQKNRLLRQAYKNYTN
ncbi:hypothetical protein FACS1894159_10770 [Bacteroidia bacterium]|nr:hypothetical protein FACS1894159_10770 [Bacteroidia bacterium]